MFRREVPRAPGSSRPEGLPRWVFALAAVASASAIAFAALRLRRRRRHDDAVSALDSLEAAAVERLRGDSVSAHCAIDVEALAPGIIELTGVVPTPDAGQRAARLLHALPGVRTVINRLEIGSVEERIASRRQRGRAGVAVREQPWRRSTQRAVDVLARDASSAPETST